jgi:hypothetical protein
MAPACAGVTRWHLVTIGYQGVDIGQLLASLEAAGVGARDRPVGTPELGVPKDLRAHVAYLGWNSSAQVGEHARGPHGPFLRRPRTNEHQI